MLTVFAAPKAFVAPFDLIQKNAVTSWRALGARVLLLGEEEGVARAAADLGVEHLGALARTPYGTPRLDDTFARARAASTDPILCYVNGDVLLPPALVQAVREVAATRRRFLLVGRCADVEPPVVFDPSTPDWAARLAAGAPLRGHDYLDWFVFSRDLFTEMPPFALGRAGFDNWLVWRARASGAAVVDASPAFLAVHQRHAHSHLAGGVEWAYSGPEAVGNIELAGGRRHLYTMLDATHVLDSRLRVRRNPRSIARAAHHVHRARLAQGRIRRSASG